ncbi:hypothetical protein [Streptomyces sp. AS02]|uniref:hypothetical protein n=1 Tax=Streptomyces sp. AS02 TaxID=2938946 RepID=UPI002020C508|nr:hypothetical protein [Streptomyces sp. AS02]MCL8014233.1 hypothetical protein [Streptomyces sp. AS02]
MSKVDDAKSLIQQTLGKALVAQQPLAKKNVERLRGVHPDDTPQELIRRLDRYYLAGVTASGGASGAAAIVPGAGIPAARVFAEASAFYLLSVAEVHGRHPEDFEQWGRLVSTVLLGGGAVRIWGRVVEHTGPYWGRRIVDATPMSSINRANKVLRPHFVTKYGTKRGVLVLSEQVPVGVGAALGASGHHVLGRLTIRFARAIFGKPPSSWDGEDRGDEAPIGPGSGDPTS